MATDFSNIFATVLGRVHAALGALTAAGSAARARCLARGGRAAARCRAWRHGDQCRDGAGEGSGQEAARACRADCRKAARRRSDREGRCRGAGLHQSGAQAGRVGGHAAQRDRRRAPIIGKGRAARHAGQRRICLGQSDRPDACRPLPRRGVRRCAREPARFRRPRGDARILHQRCRRAGRCARALGLSALPRGARRRHRRSRTGSIPAIISSRSAQRSSPSTAARSTRCPRSNGLPIVRAKAIDDDDGDRSARISPRSMSASRYSSPNARLSKAPIRSAPRSSGCASAGMSMKAACRRRKARRSRTGRIASRRCSARPRSATTSTAR